MFDDRASAGRALADRLVAMDLPDPVVLALPRGGVAVATAIARALHAPLDVLLVRKIGVPYQPELAAAAVVDGDMPELVINEDVCRMAGMDRAVIDEGAASALEEIARRRKVYCAGRALVPVAGRTVIVVDDGIATGTTVRAALQALRRKQPKAVVLAVPVAPQEALDALAAEADAIVCLASPEPFFAIGPHYADFHQMEDDEVVHLLAEADRAG